MADPSARVCGSLLCVAGGWGGARRAHGADVALPPGPGARDCWDSRSHRHPHQPRHQAAPEGQGGDGPGRSL
eukprot:4360447-Pyramimonas_sp.AAC.1